MIYVKTNLKKIPDTCNKCKFSNHDKYFDIKTCTLLNKHCKKIQSNSGNWMYTKLKDCPLIDMK
jgi:hypothetical protein